MSYYVVRLPGRRAYSSAVSLLLKLQSPPEVFLEVPSLAGSGPVPPGFDWDLIGYAFLFLCWIWVQPRILLSWAFLGSSHCCLKCAEKALALCMAACFTVQAFAHDGWLPLRLLHFFAWEVQLSVL